MRCLDILVSDNWAKTSSIAEQRTFISQSVCERCALSVVQEGPEPVSEIIQELQDCDASVCFAVDATQLAKSLQARRCI